MLPREKKEQGDIARVQQGSKAKSGFESNLLLPGCVTLGITSALSI